LIGVNFSSFLGLSYDGGISFSITVSSVSELVVIGDLSFCNDVVLLDGFCGITLCKDDVLLGGSGFCFGKLDVLGCSCTACDVLSWFAL